MEQCLSFQFPPLSHLIDHTAHSVSANRDRYDSSSCGTQAAADSRCYAQSSNTRIHPFADDVSAPKPSSGFSSGYSWRSTTVCQYYPRLLREKLQARAPRQLPHRYGASLSFLDAQPSDSSGRIGRSVCGHHQLRRKSTIHHCCSANGSIAPSLRGAAKGRTGVISCFGQRDDAPRPEVFGSAILYSHHGGM